MNKPFIGLGLLLVLILGIAFLWWPEYQEFFDLREKVKGKETELTNKKEYFSQLSSLSEKLEIEYQNQMAKIDLALPISPNVPELFHFLEKESSINGLILTKVGQDKASSQKEKPEIRKIGLNISLTGSYSALKNFLSSLQKNIRLIEVESISFSSPEKGEIFNFDLKINTHFISL